MVPKFGSEIQPFLQIRLKPGSGQNFGQISRISGIGETVPSYLTNASIDIFEVQFKTD